ncbi:TonB-linked SusC/RagA family outer membrane protein [Arenibacter sp. ARW7G5Y1]|nr:TonB-linked SusC/RagA family outer membrane protein [Arenibacter sp. ARW7G5Y1]
MKIKLIQSRSFVRMRVLFMIMRTFIFLLCTTVFGITTEKSFSQEKIIIDANKVVSVDEVFDIIQNQTKYRFLYPDDLFADAPQVQLQKGVIGVDELLKQSLSKSAVEFELSRKNRIVIRERHINSVSTEEVLLPQQYEVSGTVTDQTGQPLPGANIVEKGTANGVTADFDGNFSIDVANENVTLVVSYIGYATKEVPIRGEFNLNVVLEESAAGLEEVVVVGYGTQSKDALTGSVAQIKSDDFNKRPLTNASQALQGLAAGVHVSQLSGEPGQDVTQITIRGISSFTGSNSALVLVDGIEADLNAVNPDDIDTISVLKDASATAIYGSRAANGVILVTTKRGKKGEGQLNIDMYSGFQTATRLPQQVSDPLTYINVHNMAFEVPTTGDLNGPIGAPFLSDAALARYQAFLDETGFQGTDWIDEVFNTAPINRINVSARGGSEKSNYFASASYLDQEGISIGTGSKQGTFRLNLDSQITEKIQIGATVTGNYRENIRPNISSGGGQLFLAIRRHPTVPVQLDNGAWTGNKFEQGGFGADWDNPIAIANETKNTAKELRTLGNVYIQYEPIKDLKIKGLASGNMTNIDITAVNNAYDYWRVRDYFEDGTFSRAGGNFNNSLNKEHTTSFNTLLQTTINYDFDINQIHYFEILGGYSEELQRSESLNAGTSQYNQPGIEVIGNLNPENEIAGGSANHIAFRSYFGRLNYDFEGKYLLTANFRADATSRFAPENRWGYFPSFSAGWILSKENFFNTDGLINFLKLRGSWGEVGNQDTGGLYLYQSSVAQNAGLSYVFDNQQALGAGPTSLANRDAIWETAVKKDIALEGRLFKNRLNFNFNYFFETRKDQLLGFPVPGLAGGLGNPVVNLAEVDAWGWDFALGYSNSVGDFNYSVSGNLSHAENEVIKIAGDVDRIIRGPVGTQLVEVGYPIDQPFLIVADGLFESHEEAQAAPITDGRGNQTAGDIKYIDQNGDGVISQQAAADDKVPVGKPYPDLVYGFNIDFNYKGIDLSIQANGVAGVDYWATYHAVEPFSSQGGIPKRYLEESVSFNPNGTLPRVVFQGVYHGNEGLRFPSTFDLYPGGYLRIKNIQIGYSFPQSVISTIGLSKFRIYANAQNPFLITNLFDGIDPERPLGNGGSVDFNRIPTTKIISLGFNIAL